MSCYRHDDSYSQVPWMDVRVVSSGLNHPPSICTTVLIHRATHSLLFQCSMLKVLSFLKIKKSKKIGANLSPLSTLSETGHASIYSAMLFKPIFSCRCVALFVFPNVQYGFYFIEGGVGYLPFKKMNRKFKTHKMGKTNQCTRIGLVKPRTTLKWLWFWSEEALLPAHSLMLPFKSSSGDAHGPLACQEDSGSTKKKYLALEGMALSVSIQNGAQSGNSLEVYSHGHLMKMCGRWLSGKKPSLDHPCGSFAQEMTAPNCN